MNSKRVTKNQSGQVMIPMNIEGGNYSESSMSGVKIGCTAALVALALLAATQISKLESIALKVLAVLAVAWVILFIFRKVVMQENYYSKIYKKAQQYTNTTPAIFWNIPNIQDTYRGAVLLYSDGKTGVIIKAERDTITGKTDEFVESHFDAVSDFYKAVNQRQLRLVQMNVMEPAGKDSRLSSLDSLVVAPSNQNISRLMEMEIGHIRNTTRETLYETEYFLIYSMKGIDSDKMLALAGECAGVLLNGAYSGYVVLDRKETMDLLKSLYGVQYFDYAKATVGVYKNSGYSVPKALSVVGVKYTDGTEEKVDYNGNIRLANLAGYVDKGALEPGKWTVREALKGLVKNNNLSKQGPGVTGAAGQKKNGASDGPADSIYINLDSDEFGEYTETEPGETPVPEDGRRVKRGALNKVGKPKSKRFGGWKSRGVEVEPDEEIGEALDEEIDVTDELPPDAIKLGIDENDTIDL